MSRFLKYLTAISVILLALSMLASAALANPEEKKSGHTASSAEISKEEKAKSSHESIKSEKEEKHGEEEGEEHHEPWFMEITGWQSVFTILAILYFAAVLNFLPKVLTDKSEGGHH